MISVMKLVLRAMFLALAPCIGSWQTTIGTRLDSENPISGTITGTYNNGYKASMQFALTAVAVAPQIGYTAGTPQALPGFPLVTVADIQMYAFTADQGTAAYPLSLIFTSDTSKTVTVKLIAGQTVYWDGSQVGTTTHATAADYGVFSGDNNAGTVTAFGNIASATLTIPAGLALVTPALVNLTARIAF